MPFADNNASTKPLFGSNANNMKRLFILFSLAICITTTAMAQSYTQHLQEKKQGQGSVAVTQSYEIDKLVNSTNVSARTQETADKTKPAAHNDRNSQHAKDAQQAQHTKDTTTPQHSKDSTRNKENAQQQHQKETPQHQKEAPQHQKEAPQHQKENTYSHLVPS